MEKILQKILSMRVQKKHVTGKAIYTDDIPEPQKLTTCCNWL